MSETTSPSRVEPILDPGPQHAPHAVEELRAAVAPPVASPPVPAPAPDRPSSVVELLARLEDKTARIEEKLSRAESSTARVVDRFEASSHRMNEVAQHSELMAVRGETKYIARRVKNLPGFPALILSSVVTAVLTAVVTVVIIRYLPALIGR